MSQPQTEQHSQTHLSDFVALFEDRSSVRAQTCFWCGPVNRGKIAHKLFQKHVGQAFQDTGRWGWRGHGSAAARARKGLECQNRQFGEPAYGAANWFLRKPVYE